MFQVKLISSERRVPELERMSINVETDQYQCLMRARSSLLLWVQLTGLEDRLPLEALLDQAVSVLLDAGVPNQNGTYFIALSQLVSLLVDHGEDIRVDDFDSITTNCIEQALRDRHLEVGSHRPPSLLLSPLPPREDPPAHLSNPPPDSDAGVTGPTTP